MVKTITMLIICEQKTVLFHPTEANRTKIPFRSSHRQGWKYICDIKFVNNKSVFSIRFFFIPGHDYPEPFDQSIHSSLFSMNASFLFFFSSEVTE